MTVIHRGFELKAEREEALGGWENLYFSAYRTSDGWCFIEDFTTGEDAPEVYIEIMKARVDAAFESDGRSECESEFAPDADCPCSVCSFWGIE